MHNPFRNFHLTYNYARASAQNHHVYIFLSPERTTITRIYTLLANQYAYMHIIQYSYHLQVAVYAKLSLFCHCQVNYFLDKFEMFKTTFLSHYCFNSNCSILVTFLYQQIQCNLLFISLTAWKYKRHTS